jgi:hypothetical protein
MINSFLSLSSLQTGMQNYISNISSGVNFVKYLEMVGLSGAENVFLYGDASLWYDLFTNTIMDEAIVQNLEYYYMFRLSVHHMNKLSAKSYNLHHSTLLTNSKHGVVRRHGKFILLLYTRRQCTQQV